MIKDFGLISMIDARLVPDDQEEITPGFGHWETVYGYFRRWRRKGVWEQVMTELRQIERRCQGRLAQPSAGAIDSQSVKRPPKARRWGSTGTNKSKGASAICWWTRSG